MPLTAVLVFGRLIMMFSDAGSKVAAKKVRSKLFVAF